MRRKKILIHTDFSLASTGFGRFSKGIIKYLYSKDKYDIVHYAMNAPVNQTDLKRTPWLTIGCLPDQNEVNQYLNQFRPEEREMKFRNMCYGEYLLDKAITEHKPDVYFGVQDIWGVEFAVGRQWFNDITSVIWTTLDSLPILPTAVNLAPQVKNYWIWSDFATKALHKMNHKHVKTMHGALECSHFFKLPDEDRKTLRNHFGIANDCFIIGFVFRNQLRKSVPNLLEGFALFKKQNPHIKTKLLFHTNYSEGWDIKRLSEEYGVDSNDILTTYLCKSCSNYEVKPFTNQDLDCKYCGTQKSQITTNVVHGVSEEQLNHIYNLMDVYCHPFTSGGQELPIQEAKLVELTTLVTSYSCGEELCYPEAKSLSLEWTEYREFGTQFIKASTKPESIAKQLALVHRSPLATRAQWGKQAREWVLKNFSVESIGAKLEDFIDKAPFIDDEKVFDLTKSPKAEILPIEDNKEWLKTLYKKILKMDVIDTDSGLQYWLSKLVENMARQDIEKYFRQVAEQDNLKIKGFDLESWLDPEDKNKRILIVMPESIGDVFMITGLFESIAEGYPKHSLYVATKQEYFDVLNCNPHITKVIQYIPQMDNLLWLEGQWTHKGFFEIAFLPFLGTQRYLDYLHQGGADKIQYDIKRRMILWTGMTDTKTEGITCTL